MTSSHPTLFRRPASADGPTPGSSFGLAPEVAKKARVRVKWFAFAMLAMSLIGVGFNVVFLAVGVELPAFSTNLLILGANAAVAATIWWVARTPRFGDSLVLTLGLVLEVLICLGAAIGTNMDVYQKHGAMAEMSWVTPIIILFPLIIPYPPRRMLVASLITACTEPASVLLMWSTLPIAPAPEHLMVVIYPTLAAGLAYYASRTIWGLNVEVTRARRLGSYQLEARLGRGGMGEVWRASHHMLARPAAVKLIHPEALAEDATRAQAVLERFEQEAQATASLRSPHTIQLYDFGRAEDGAFYYVMELLEGLDLSTLVDKYGPQEPARVIHLLVQACHSLEEAHRAGLIHRDIKPANLFVCRYGTDDDFVKVLDFGLVKEVTAQGDKALQLTQHGVVVGTPGFMPPELALGKDDVDGRADLYSLGCVAYWLLTGSLVFEGDTPMEQMVQHAKDPPPPPSSRSEHEIPEALERTILSCLAKDPAERPASAQDLARQLQGCPMDRPWTPERAHRWWEVHRPAGADQSPALEFGSRMASDESRPRQPRDP